jgi:hypothetical protein
MHFSSVDGWVAALRLGDAWVPDVTSRRHYAIVITILVTAGGKQ